MGTGDHCATDGRRGIAAAASGAFALALALLLGVALARPAAAAERTFPFGPFGTVHVELPAHASGPVVLFASGDGGWNLGVVDMARALAAQGAVVVGFDVPHYLKEAANRGGETCTYAAGDFEALSQFAQRELKLPRYEVPLLVGYSSGATLVYAVLAQAPAGAFRGAMSLGFCPDLPLHQPFCHGRDLTAADKKDRFGHTVFLPSPRLSAPWVVLQGDIDEVCSPALTRAFAAAVPQAELVDLPHVGHGYSVQRNWMPQFTKGYVRLAAVADPQGAGAAADLTDLPMVEVPAAPGTGGDTFAVFVSGDGGWAELDREVSAALAAQGVPVAGLNSLRYFWQTRTPEGAAADLARIVRHYSERWGRTRVILAGYSRGADVVPFMAAGLPEDLKRRVALVALLGPGKKIDFTFHLTDWLGGTAGTYPVTEQIQKLWDVPVLCVYGASEKDSSCPRLPEGRARRVVLEGAHHFGGDYPRLAREILAGVPGAGGTP